MSKYTSSVLLAPLALALATLAWVEKTEKRILDWADAHPDADKLMALVTIIAIVAGLIYAWYMNAPFA